MVDVLLTRGSYTHQPDEPHKTSFLLFALVFKRKPNRRGFKKLQE